MDAIDQLLHLHQGGLSIEEYVHQFCELTYQVPLYDEFLFKDLFHFGLNRHVKSMFNKSLFPGGVFNGSLRGLMDYALLCAGSSFTVGVAEEEHDTALTHVMTDAPEGTHKMVEATTHHQSPESHNMPTEPESAPEPAPSQELAESAPEPAPSQELAESAPEAAPSQELAESAPEAAPSQELAESAPEPAPSQELAESAPEPAPSQELAESTPEAAPIQ